MSAGIPGRAAVLGLGIIGSRASERLAGAGWNVARWNRTPKGVAQEVSSPEEAVNGANVISIYLKDAPALREVVARVESVLQPGQTVFNHATVDLETTLLIEAVSRNVSGSPLAAMKFPTMVAGNYDIHFSLANMGKDSRYMLALAAAAGVETPAIAAVSQRMAELCDAGFGGLDYSALAKPYLEAR